MALPNSKALWHDCQKYLKQNLGQEQYESFFAFVSFATFNVAGQTLELAVPNWEIAKRIEKDEKIFNLFKVGLLNTFGKIRLKWSATVAEKGAMHIESEPGVLSPPIQPATPQQSYAPGTPSQQLPPIDSQLDRNQTFNTFFESKSNKLSRSMGLTIAEHPQSPQFNPMFVHGPSGCGKTHLVNAIGNHCKARYPQKRVLYVTARTFQMQYSNASMQGKVNDFIAFYQTIDMLIVDDVQEWMSANKTQDTFFHIFNHLFRNGRRIVLVSDRPPGQLENMNKRLLTRFAMGLMAEMEKPNEELCLEILKRKVGRDGLKVPQDVMVYIASHANGSVREIEGVINSLMAFAIVYNCNIDMRLVERVVQRAVKTDDQPLTVDDILNCVCRHYEVTPNNIRSKSRKREYVIPRQLSMFLAKRYTNIPSSRIGRMIGNRDHSTVLHSISAIENAIKNDKEFAKRVKKIEESLKIKQ